MSLISRLLRRKEPAVAVEEKITWHVDKCMGSLKKGLPVTASGFSCNDRSGICSICSRVLKCSSANYLLPLHKPNDE